MSHDLNVTGEIARQVVLLPPDVGERVLVGGRRCEACVTGTLYVVDEPELLERLRVWALDDAAKNGLPFGGVHTEFARCDECATTFPIVATEKPLPLEVIHVLEADAGDMVYAVLTEPLDEPFTVRSWIRFEDEPETIRIVKREAWEKGDYDNAYVDVDAGTYLVIDRSNRIFTVADQGAVQARNAATVTARDFVPHLTHGCAVMYGMTDTEIGVRCLDCQEDIVFVDMPPKTEAYTSTPR